MIPDRFQYFLDDFWNFDNLVEFWTRRPASYIQNAFRKYKTIMGTSWKHIIFVNLGLKKIEQFQIYRFCFKDDSIFFLY